MPTSEQDIKTKYYQRLWQSLFDDQRYIFIRIIKKYPELLLLPAPNKMQFKSLYNNELIMDISGETPLSFCAKKTRIEALKIITPFLIKLASQSEEHYILIQGSLAKWPAYSFIHGHFVLPKKYKDLIEPLIKALSSNPMKRKKSMIEEFEEDVWPVFRNKLLPKKAVALDNSDWNMDLLLLAARVLYENNMSKFEDYNMRGVYLIRVLGFLQRLASPETAKVLCADLEKVVYEGYKVSDRTVPMKFFDKANGIRQEVYSEQEMALKTLDLMNFYPARSSDKSGQGYEWFCDRGMMTVGAYSASGLSSETWTQFMLQKQTAYEEIILELAKSLLNEDNIFSLGHK